MTQLGGFAGIHSKLHAKPNPTNKLNGIKETRICASLGSRMKFKTLC